MLSRRKQIDIKTRYGRQVVTGRTVGGTDIIVHSRSLQFRYDRKIISWHKGMVFLPNRKNGRQYYMIYQNIFDALRSRSGVKGYYGDQNRGAKQVTARAIVETQTIAQIASSTSIKAFYKDLAERLETALDSMDTIVNCLDKWHGALLEEFRIQKTALNFIRARLVQLDSGEAINSDELKQTFGLLRFSPFVELRKEFAWLFRKDVAKFTNTHGRFNEGIARINKFQALIKIEEVHFLIKYLERALLDDRLRPAYDENVGLASMSYGTAIAINKLFSDFSRTVHDTVIEQVYGPLVSTSKMIHDKNWNEACGVVLSARKALKVITARATTV